MVRSKVTIGLHLLLCTWDILLTLENTFQLILSVVLSKIHNIGSSHIWLKYYILEWKTVHTWHNYCFVPHQVLTDFGSVLELFWIGLENNFSLLYFYNLIDVKFFGLVQKYFGSVERHIISLYSFNPWYCDRRKSSN